MLDPRLPRHWHDRDGCVVLETDFGQGRNFMAVWEAWQRDPGRCRQLHYIALVPAWPSLQALTAACGASDRMLQLQAAWPPCTPNLHRLNLADGRVRLLLLPGNVRQGLSDVVAEVDCFFLDPVPAGAAAPPLASLFKALARLAAPQALLAAPGRSAALDHAAASAGFVPDAAALAQGGQASLARYAPPFHPRPGSRVRPPRDGEKTALVVGGGLAGCAAAWALAEQGWQCTVLDRHPAPARETSGNPAGLFHGIVNRQDGVHARFNRAAALQAREAVQCAITRHDAAGEVNGLLRLETSFGQATAMNERLGQLGLPADYVQGLSASEASALAGTPLTVPAWFYPGGGWIDPAGLAASYLARAGNHARFEGHSAVHTITRDGLRWTARDARGQVLASAATLVLANAGDALRLLHRPPWPLGAVRGQLSLLPADGVARHGLSLPALPVAGAGYLLQTADGSALFGATSDREDADPTVRDTDHARNLQQAARLLDGLRHVATHELKGRTGWRWVTDDRLPIVGAVPDEVAAGNSRLDHARGVPRVPGLFVFTALGSRGITWSALGARVLAATITGTPVPLEASLVDAIDPARFIARASRRAATDTVASKT